MSSKAHRWGLLAAPLALSVLLVSGCKPDAPTSSQGSAASSATSDGSSGAQTSSSAAPPSSSAAPAGPGPCGDDMVVVEGRYCPLVKHRCLEHSRDYEEDLKYRARVRARGLTPPPSSVPERCLRYQEPGKCLSPSRRQLRFCMDRYEWPNQKGKLPALLVTWVDADKACRAAGKRLCTSDEFNFACEGEALRPYSYGYQRDAARCNIDKRYVQPRRRLMPYEACMDSTNCKAHLEELDQRVPIGATPNCTSVFGVHDLNGNVNEWVSRPGQQPPWRSGLKGGWWGPARSRCRPMVIVHDENYAGYEVGFRCCRDAPSTKPR